MTQSNVKWVRLGDYIEARNERNSDLRYGVELIEGVNSNGEFQPTKAVTDGIDMKPYKAVWPGDIAYNPSRLNIGSLAFRHKDAGMCIVSHLYQVFHVKDEYKDVLLPEFLLIFFKRDEFSRIVDYYNYGSQRAEFNLKKLGELNIPLPSIDSQREIVDTWQGLRKMKEENEQIATPLMQLCQSYIQDLKKNYPLVEIGPYIKRIDEKNRDNSIKIVKSVSVSKEFNDTNAKVDKSNLSSYKIVYPKQISFVQTTGNEKCLCAAINDFGYPVVVTSVNEVFECDSNKLLPEFVHLYFRRKETDRYARFHSWGSARETFTWNDMLRFKMPIPPIDIQKAIVDIYYCAKKAVQIAQEADILSRDICPALMQHCIHSN